MATVGYSGTPLAKKLGIKPGTAILTIDAPNNYRTLLSPLPTGVAIVTKSKPGEARSCICS